ncbi:MAG: hypothetical protein ABSE95_06695 [Thermodesulfobacteriota bacterium]
MLKKAWNFSGDVRVNFWLLFSISINLAIGAYYIKYNPKLFMPLNHSLIQDWFMEYGQYQPGRIWWFGTLLALLFFLGINTIVCAIKRITQLWPKKNQLGLRIFSVKITPSFIHLCFLIMLSGHFLSLIIGFQQNIPLKFNQKIALSQGRSLEVISQKVERYMAPAALNGMIKQCTVLLKIQGPEKTETRELSILNPIHWQGMSFHLDAFIKPDSQKTFAPPELNLIIKKDPGLPLILPGFAVLCLLMFWYFPQRKKT